MSLPMYFTWHDGVYQVTQSNRKYPLQIGHHEIRAELQAPHLVFTKQVTISKLNL